VFEEIPDNLPHIDIDASAFETVQYMYKTPEICTDERVQALLKNLTVKEMVEMITITRAYESNQKALQTADTMIEKAVNEVGRLG
jgi:flagellar basal body rod protein FlgC